METAMLYRMRVELTLRGWGNFTSDQVLVKFLLLQERGLLSPCHILRPRNHCAMLRIACLEIRLAGRLLQPVETTL
jgi:hypothetical protein